MVMATLITVIMIVVMISDFTKFIIPNWLNIGFLALYPVAVYLVPEPPEWWWSLALGVGMFFVGFGLFIVRFMGGGDVKLLAVCGVWTGLSGILEFLLYTALYGGALSIILLIGRPSLEWMGGRLNVPAGKFPRVFVPGEPLPYGLAIAAGMLTMVWLNKLEVAPL